MTPAPYPAKNTALLPRTAPSRMSTTPTAPNAVDTTKAAGRLEMVATNRRLLVVGLDAPGDQKPAGPLGFGIPLDQLPKGAAVVGHLEMGEFVHDHVVE